MVYISLIVFGGILFAFGCRLLGDFNEDVSTTGVFLLLVGSLIMIGSLLVADNTQKVEAKEYCYPVAGITRNEAIMLQMAMNKPSAGIVKQVNSIVKEDGENNITIIKQSDIDLLARLMTAEQGYGADERDYYLTGSVVINRMNMERYPNTLQDVIYDYGQYQCVENGHINRPYDEVAYQVAEELLVYGTEIPEDVIYQAEFIQGSDIYDKRNRTYYCYQ